MCNGSLVLRGCGYIFIGDDIGSIYIGIVLTRFRSGELGRATTFLVIVFPTLAVYCRIEDKYVAKVQNCLTAATGFNSWIARSVLAVKDTTRHTASDDAVASININTDFPRH